MAIVLEGDGTITGVTTFTTPLDDIKFDSINVTGIATAGTFQAGTGVSMASPRSQNIALFTNNVEGLTLDDAGRLGIGISIPNQAADANNVKVVNAGIITANQYYGNQLTAVGSRVTGVGTFENGLNITGNITNGLKVSAGIVTVAGAIDANGALDVDGQTDLDVLNVSEIATFAADVSIADKIIHTGDTDTAIRFPAANEISFETTGVEGVRIDSQGRLLIGVTASTPTDNDANNVALQIEGTAGNDERAMIRANNTTAGNGPFLYLARSRGTSLASKTSVSADDSLGGLVFNGADGSDDTRAASIQAFCDGTPGTDDMPGRLVFYTTADGAGNYTERLRIDSSGRLIVGAVANNDVGGFGGSALQIEGLNAPTSSISLLRHSNDAAGSTILMGKSRGTADAATTIVQSGDAVARIIAYGADGTDMATPVGGIEFAVDGTPGANDMPGRIVFKTTADGANDYTERLRIHSNGMVTVGNDPSGAASYGGQMVVATTTGGVLTLADTGSGERLQLEGGAGLPRIGTISSHHLSFFTNGIDKERFRIAQGTAGTCTILFGGVTNDSNKSCSLGLNHYTFNTYNQIDMIKGTSTSGVNKIEIGGSDSSAGTSAATSIQLYTAANATTNNGTLRLKIDSSGVAHFSGDVKVLTGDIQMGSGRGINFTANSNAGGMTSETFDDYEEGTWTPNINFSVGGNTATYGTNTGGWYTKVGRIVTCNGRIQISAKGGGSSAVQFGGLPFTVGNNNSGTSGIEGGLTFAYAGNCNADKGSGWIGGYANESSTYAVPFYVDTSNNFHYVEDFDIDSDFSVGFTITYAV